MNTTVKELYSLILKYQQDASKYQDMNAFVITMDFIRSTMFDLVNIPYKILWPYDDGMFPYQLPIYTAQQRQYFTLELLPHKAADFIEVEFTIEKNKK